jgi:hypothetical protein
LITFTHKEWACADNNIQFNIGRAKQMVRNALMGTDFIGCFEAAVYNNEERETDGVVGKLISFHCHAISWASSYSLLSRLRSRFKSIQCEFARPALLANATCAAGLPISANCRMGKISGSPRQTLGTANSRAHVIDLLARIFSAQQFKHCHGKLG